MPRKSSFKSSSIFHKHNYILTISSLSWQVDKRGYNATYPKIHHNHKKCPCKIESPSNLTGWRYNHEAEIIFKERRGAKQFKKKREESISRSWSSRGRVHHRAVRIMIRRTCGTGSICRAQGYYELCTSWCFPKQILTDPKSGEWSYNAWQMTLNQLILIDR